jgi:hypothetical protein
MRCPVAQHARFGRLLAFDGYSCLKCRFACGSVTSVEVIDHVLSTLSETSGVLRCRHGERLLVLYARGIAAVEVAPRGAVL